MPTPYTKEQIQKANSINLIEYAKLNGFQLENGGKQSLHAKNSGGLYFFRDSNRYYHFTTQKHGSPIDFVIQFEGKTFLEAVEILLNERPYTPEFKPMQYRKEKRGELALPEKADNFKRVFWYLCTVRGIDPEIVFKMMDSGKVYQQAGRGNCVFVGFDEKNVPKYCAKRGTSTVKAYKGDETNSDKSYPFVMEGRSSRVYVLESPIDVMSHATLTKMKGNIDYTQDYRISLGCLSDKALERFLKANPAVKEIVFALDNDFDGKDADGQPRNHGQVTAAAFCKKYQDKGFKVFLQKPKAKDFNEDLCAVRAAEAERLALHERIHDCCAEAG